MQDKYFIVYDKQAITQLGLEYLLKTHFTTKRQTTITSKNDLVNTLLQDSRAVVILDFTNSDINSIDSLLNIYSRFEETSWIIFSDDLNNSLLERISINTDRLSFVFKSATIKELLDALKKALINEKYYCTQTKDLLEHSNKEESNKEKLTATEIEILTAIALGKTAKEIAAERNASFHTITTHKKNIYRKLKINSFTEAYRYALRAGYIDIADYYI